jgi:hypothetical protein
VILVA